MQSLAREADRAVVDADAHGLQARGNRDGPGGRYGPCWNLVGQLANHVGLIIVRDQYAFVGHRGLLENQ